MLMKKLDKKMVPKFTLVYPTTVLVAIGITTTLVFNSSIIRHSNQKSTGKTTSSLITKRTNSNEENENKLDNRKTQIQSINKQEKKSVVEIYEEKAKEEISFSFQSLPILHFDKFEFKNKDRVNLAKETYLNDYKVVDYRFYRKRPLEEQKNELLTGVPASFETNENLKTNDELEIEKSYFNFLEKSLKLLKEEKYNFAEERFELILKTYELDVNALFYLAITKYKLKEYRSCLEMLDKLENARKLAELNEEIVADRDLGKGFMIGHSFFSDPPINPPDGGRAWYKNVIETEIDPLLREYWFDKTDDDLSQRVTDLLG